MALPINVLQDVLLDLISTRRQVTPQRSAALDAGDWARLLDMARQQRLFPLMHWRLAREQAAAVVPDGVRQMLAEAFNKSTMRALRFQRELLLVGKRLDDAGIASLALKGAFLAFHTYPHPALRPMRDLDLLLSKDRALEAFQILVDAGFQRQDHAPGDPAAWLAVRKHLPPLSSRPGRVTVELHIRLSDHAQAIHVHEGALWQRAVSIDVAGQPVSYLSHTDLLLHLIYHAVYDHRFSNGPQVLPDLAYMVESGKIDWPLFWDEARKGGATRGCVLLLSMVQRYFGELKIDFPAAAGTDFAASDALQADCARLMLSDIVALSETRLAGFMAGRPLHRQVTFLLSKVFPPPAAAAVGFPAPTRRYQRVTHYMAYVSNVLTRRLPQFLARKHDGLVGNGRKMAALDQWLDKS